MTNTFREHLQRAILETCDLWDILSEWWGDMTISDKPQWIQILWLKIRCDEKWGGQRVENQGALMWKHVFIMWLDLDAKFVYINSLFKRPDHEIFCFIPVPLMTSAELFFTKAGLPSQSCKNRRRTYPIWVQPYDMTMHDRMTIVVKCWPLSRFLLHLQLALYFSSYFHSLLSYTMFSKLMLAQINLKQEWLYWCNPGLWIKATFISAIAKNLS